VLLVTCGGSIMLYSIISFYKSLVNFKMQANEQRIFGAWVYTASMVLMLFFLVGYIVVNIIFIFEDTASTMDLIIALIFFFGSIFVYTMVITLKRMSATISQKADGLIKAIVQAVEAKDKYTYGHSVHVADVSELIYNYMHDKMKSKINKQMLKDAAILHDIGKIGVPDNILNKPDRLTPEERKVIEQHPLLGKNILESTSHWLIGDIVYCHHERVDGNGYYNVPTDRIPLESKIIAVADTFSALCTDRVYRAKKSHKEAMQIIQAASGTQLDAEIVEVFCSIPENEFENISM